MSVDTIGDFLTIIRNGIMASKRSVVAPFSRMKLQIAQILKDEGFIRDFEVVTQEGEHKKLNIVLRYVDGESAIHEITRESKPSLRVYEHAKDLKPVVGKLGIAILTTNKGLMSSKKAKDLSIGGEVICSVW